jgi:hypothetical protein
MSNKVFPVFEKFEDFALFPDLFLTNISALRLMLKLFVWVDGRTTK